MFDASGNGVLASLIVIHRPGRPRVVHGRRALSFRGDHPAGRPDHATMYGQLHLDAGKTPAIDRSVTTVFDPVADGVTLPAFRFAR